MTVLAIAVLAAGIGLRDPWGVDEPRYALVGHEMVAGSSWILPHRHGLIYGEKPPAGFWAFAGAELLTGSWVWGFLLPGALAGLGIALLVHDFATRWHGRQAGLAAAAALLLMSYGVELAKSAQLDPQVTFWATLGLVGLLRHLWWGPRPLWLVCGCLSMGIGVITKGTAFLPLLLIPIWWWARPQRPWSWSRDAGIAAWSCFLVLLPAVLWLAPLAWKALNGDQEITRYISTMTLRQTAQRYAAAWHHHEPPWYYIEVLLTRWQPWLALAIVGLPAWWRRWRRKDPEWRSLFVFSLTVLLFFSFSPGKRALYLMPLMPVAAMLSGPGLAAMARSVTGWRWSCRLAIGLGILLITFACVQVLLPVPDGIAPWPRLTTGVLLGSAGCGLVFTTSIIRQRLPINPLILAVAFLWVLVGLLTWPNLNHRRSWEPMALAITERLPIDAVIGISGPEEGFDLHYSGIIQWFPAGSPQDRWRKARTWQTAAPNRWLLWRADAVPEEITTPKILYPSPRGRVYRLLEPESDHVHHSP